MAVLLGLFATEALLRGLNAAHERSARRAERNSQRALHEARLALIAYALVEDNTPGSLPCPSPGLDGKGGTNCIQGSAAFGRLPWHQLGMMARFDGDGECLWYGLSRDFVNQGNVSQRNSGNAINPSRPGALVLDDAGTSESLVGIVLAPGIAFPAQAAGRQYGGQACTAGTAVAFLEADNADGDSRYLRRAAGPDFNDQLAGLSREHLLRPLLKRVLLALSDARLREEIGERLARTPAAVTLAELRQTDPAGFDQLLHPAAPTPPSGACPYSPQLALHPVAWLCFNDWYGHIQPQMGPGGWTLKLSLNPLQGGYACRLDVISGTVSCSGEG